MSEREKLIEFIEKEPELLKILKSKEYMQVLEEISKEPPKIENLKVKTCFKNVSILYNILDTLIQKNFVKKIEVDKEEFYYLTEKGKEFFEMYKVAKEKFNLNGGD